MSNDNKKNRLIARAQQTTRQPKLPDNARPEKVGYRVIAISLYVPEAQFVDQLTDLLKKSGNPKANRSLVVREAILRLQEELGHKTAEELLKDFNRHSAKRGRGSSRT